MSLLNLIAEGSATALTVLRQYTGNPKVVYGDLVVPIQAFKYVTRESAVVSKKVLVDMTGKKNVTDNVAPGPHEWHMEGYIGGTPLELSILYMPSLGTYRDMLDAAYWSRQALDFYDADQKGWTLASGHPVCIELFEYEKVPGEQNRLRVVLDLRELIFAEVQTSFVSPLDPVAATATPTDGGASGAPAAAGATEVTAEPTPAAPSYPATQAAAQYVFNATNGAYLP